MNRHSKASEFGTHANTIAANTYQHYFTSPAVVTAPENSVKNTLFSYAAVGFVALGTGSSLDLKQGNLWSHQLKGRVAITIDENDIFKREVIDTHQVDLRSIKDHFVNIKTELYPAVSDLAKMFGVTRQAVYKWISGSAEPEQDNAIKIKRLSDIADKVKSSGVEKKDYLLTIKAFDGKSILDLLSNGGDVEDSKVEALLREAKIMESANSDVVVKGTPTSDWLSSESIPGSAE